MIQGVCATFFFVSLNILQPLFNKYVVYIQLYTNF